MSSRYIVVGDPSHRLTYAPIKRIKQYCIVRYDSFKEFLNHMNHDQVSKTSINLAEERLQQLADLFPEAFREGKLDVDSLRAAIGENVLDSKTERFSFTWAGKRDAIRLAQTPI